MFSPGPDELARAARLVAAVEDGQGRGAVTFEGEMADEAMAATARLSLEQRAAYPAPPSA